MVNSYINKDMLLFFVSYNKLSIFYISKEWFFAINKNFAFVFVVNAHLRKVRCL